MNNIIQTIRHTARAATVLLIALLTAQTAWAQGNVSNADDLAAAFYDQDVSVVNVTDNITVVGGLPSLDRDLTINLNGHTISYDGFCIYVSEDCSLTINGGGGNIISGDAELYAINNNGTVTLSRVNITTNSDFAIQGGMLNIGNNVSFNGWTQAPFYTQSVNITGYYRSNVVATVTVGGTPHYFENSGAALAYIVSHPDNDDFSLSGDTYTIKSSAGWNVFCDLLADNTKGFFTGKTVQLGADIGTADDPVTSMAGASGKDFTGTFDGQGNTLTVGYGTADDPFGEEYAAPFRYIEDGCTIKNLHVAGHIYTADMFAGGLAGSQYGTVSIENCRVSTVIHSSVSGDGTHGGFVAVNNSNSTLTIEGCLFDGRLLGSSTIKCGGFVGFADGVSGTTDTEVTFTNCLYAPAAIADADGEDEVDTSESATFARKNNNNITVTLTITNCYYTRTLGDAQGKALHSVTAGDDVTLALSGTATEYTVSGITAYEGNQGIKYGTTYYAGSGDAVSLTLSNTATGAPDGYQYGYTTNAGTLSGTGNTYTLTMPAEDVTISVNTAALTAIPWDGDGSEGKPYIIEYPSQLDLLAHRVNGTHGETRQTDGYKDTFFKLNNDISYTHTSDWNAFTNDESNFEAIGGYHNGGPSRSFSGHFDGNKKTISGIRIYKDGTGNVNSNQGIFGRISSSADIHDLTLADARITGYQNTGGIVGYNYGTVSRCHVTADVAVCAVQSGAGNHGGIAGYNYLGTIEQCTSAAKLTTDDADDAPTSQNYGGIAGQNNSGTLRDNLVIGATVPAAKDNRYGAITGYNDGEVTLQRNYYTACTVAGTENATGVGCSYIDYVNGGYITADVTADAGAVPGYFLTLGEGITIAGGATTITIPARGETAEVTYHVAAAGANVTLSYSGAPAAPAGYRYDGYTASAGTISGSTLTMPDQDVTVSPALRSTGQPVEVTYVDADGNTVSDQTAIALDGTETNLGAGWYFVGLPTVAFDHTLNLNGNVHLILAEGCTMNVTSSNGYGIDVHASLTIYGQTDGTGTLNATGDFNGIYNHSGDITISGGRVTASGDKGIRTGSGTITISGGRVTATSDNGDGIYTDSGDINISGGRVTATGGNGDGIHSESGTITISGGRVTATATGDYGAGIRTYSGTITLGCTTASDFIYVSRYVVGTGGTLNIADGQTLFDEDGNSYSGEIKDYNILNSKTLQPSVIALAAREAPDGNYWTTYYNSTLGFTIDEDENACAYTATYGDGKLTLHNQGKEIPAETAVIIVAENNVVSMTATTLPAYSGSTNALRGVDVDTPVADIHSILGTGTFYVLGMTTVGNEKHFGFHRYTGEEMAAHKAYVLVSGSKAPARSLTMVFDDATGIESLTPDAAPKAQAAQHWFTLDGRRLQAKPTAPGIYINNGRKVVIK